jgi:hypothetical protein
VEGGAEMKRFYCSIYRSFDGKEVCGDSFPTKYEAEVYGRLICKTNYDLNFTVKAVEV